MPKNVISVVTNKEWNEMKKGVRLIRRACHDLKPASDGIVCFRMVDEFQDVLRGLMQKRRRKARRY